MKIFAHIRWVYATIIIFIALALSIFLFPIFKAPKAQKISAKFIHLLTWFGIEKKGEEDPETQMFLINHQSDLDIEVMELLTKKELAWVAKKELFEVPFFGLALKLPQDIAVDRESKKSLIKLLKDAKNRLDLGKTITIFPEGTRNKKNPKTMLKWKKGPKAVIEKLNLKVQPFVIVNLANTLQKTKINQKNIKIIFLPLIDTSDKNWYEKTYQKMNEILQREKNEI